MAKSPLIRCFGLAVLAAAALGGCGASGSAASAPSSTGSAAGTPRSAETSGKAARKAVRKVKLEVLGKGEAVQPITYNADESGIETGATLPWSKTAKIELTDAEQEVGRLVSIVSGSVRDDNGQFRPAPCRITVDGERVVTGKGLCKFLLK
ncbi:hypothetical protein [Nonomuraea sp. SBT364]|uniref:hypothetical protein n=1 Tax=Nonomuraea sp. SBT364 TaxID=1580530 RepID=UPI0012E28170|nr:hypothetical protein [Nonomuraea sp. SBT364]